MKRISARELVNFLEQNELENITFDLVTANHKDNSLSKEFDIINNNETLRNLFKDSYLIEKEDRKIFIIKQSEESLYIIKNLTDETYSLLDKDEILDFDFIKVSKRIYSYDNEIRKVQEMLLNEFKIKYEKSLKPERVLNNDEIIKEEKLFSEIIKLRDDYLESYKRNKIEKLKVTSELYKQNRYKLKTNNIKEFVNNITETIKDSIKENNIFFEELSENFIKSIDKIKKENNLLEEDTPELKKLKSRLMNFQKK